MTVSYEVVNLNSSTFQYGRAPSSATIAEAVRYVAPTDWLVAVENGGIRSLTAAEELEFKSALGHDPSWHAPVREPEPELDYQELKRRWEIICRR